MPNGRHSGEIDPDVGDRGGGRQDVAAHGQHGVDLIRSKVERTANCPGLGARESDLAPFPGSNQRRSDPGQLGEMGLRNPEIAAPLSQPAADIGDRCVQIVSP